MRVVRPSADVARYTMIFHKRDHGNEENGERWVMNNVLPCILLVCGMGLGNWGRVLCSWPNRHFLVARGSGGHHCSQLAVVLYVRSA